MYLIEEQVLIDAPKEDVWEFMAAPDSVLLYNTGMVEYERDGEELEKGTTGHGVARFLGKKLAFETEVTEFEVGTRVGLRMVDGPFPMYVEWALTEKTDGTELTYRIESDGFGGFFGRFADPMVHRLYTREVIGMLDKIKELIEA